MYRVLKEKGNNAVVTLENTDTKASIIIGRITMEMLQILKEEGYIFSEEGGKRTIRGEWNMTISDDAAKELSREAMTISKPTRDQRKKTEQELKKKDNKKIDAMDVLLGLASYN